MSVRSPESRDRSPDRRIIDVELFLRPSIGLCLLLPLLAPSLEAQPVLKGYETRLELDGPVRPGERTSVTGRGAPGGDGIWVEIWKIPAAGGPPQSVTSVPAVNGSFTFDGISLQEGDSVYATLSRSWGFERTGDAEGWDVAAHDVVLTVTGGVLQIRLENLDGDPFTDAYVQNPFAYNPRYYRVLEVRLRNPAPPAPSRLLGILWGAPFGTTVNEHNAEIPAAMSTFQTILIPMNVDETRVVPGPAEAGLDGLWDAGTINDVLRLDPLNNIPPDDRSLDGTVLEIDHIRIREDYRFEFHHPGDTHALLVTNDTVQFDSVDGSLRYVVADVGLNADPGPGTDGVVDPYFLPGIAAGRLDTDYFTHFALGMASAAVSQDVVTVGIFFDDADSLGYWDDCPLPDCEPGTTALQELNLTVDAFGRQDVAERMDDLRRATGEEAGEWSEDGGRIPTSSLRFDCPQNATQDDAIRLDYFGWIPATPYGPSDVVPVASSPLEKLVLWDFSQGLQGWSPNFDTADVEITEGGLEFDGTGNDPWVTGPPVDYPPNLTLRVSIRMRTTADTNGQLFYGQTFTEEQSVRFSINPDGEWRDYVLFIPPQGNGTRFRLDPATGPGHITVAWICVEALTPVVAPELDVPERPRPGQASPATLSSGALELVHYQERWGGFVLNVSGVEVASSHDAGRVAFFEESGFTWRELEDLPVRVSRGGGELVEAVTFSDGLGGTWNLRRRFAGGAVEDSLDVDVEIVCDRPRHVLHVPWLTLFPGLGTYGDRKHQGLFAGLEYLADEPSSSQADITTEDHVRRVPHPRKITLPLMVVERGGRYVGLSWELSELVAAVFDSPDRVFHAPAHLMALWAPNVGALRLENAMWGFAPFALEAGSGKAVRATILGGAGGSVVPAVRQYVALRGLPPVPAFPGGLNAAVDLLAAGWLDSDIYEGGGLWRHAVWPGFGSGPASDAIAFLRWLANRTTQSTLRNRLRQEAAVALAARETDDPAYLSGVSHVRWPINALLFGNVTQNVLHRRNRAAGGAAQFEAGGIRRYPQGGADPAFGETHFADHANGYAAAALRDILEGAALSGDPALMETVLGLLDQQTALYKNTVPRGAQTWEIPLHTPDILASGWLLQCYVLAYEMTGEGDYLEQARYWAWTGVPFLYLEPYNLGPVAEYASIPVLGATNWVGSWFGRPVQWCGLVYRSWLERLALHDPEGPWGQIGGGITASGLLQTWPRGDAARQGLLPDFLVLPLQLRAGPAINPGTLQASLAELYGAGSLYGFARAESLGWFLHAPSAIHDFEESPTHVSFSADGWGPDLYRVLVSRVASRPVHVLTRPAASGGPYAAAEFSYDASNGWLIVEAEGPAELRISSENEPPAATITYPLDGARFTAPATITVEADASDVDGSILRVIFLVNGAARESDAAAPYRFVWRDVPAGTYVLGARAIDNVGARSEVAVTVTVEEVTERFIRGDTNTDGAVDISDAVFTLGHLFLGDGAPFCMKTADANRDGAIDISDPTFVLNFLFLGGAPIPPPHPDCGTDPVSDFSCASFPLCGGGG